MQNFKVLSIINKPGIGFTGRGSSTQKKIQSGFLAGCYEMTTPGSGTEGYNQSYNFRSTRCTSIMSHHKSRKSFMSNTRYIERKYSVNTSWNTTEIAGGVNL